MQKLILLVLLASLAGCTFGFEPADNPGGSVPIGGESGTVTRVIDGDTIDVSINGQTYRVRYVGVNTPERDEVCYQDATNANRVLIEGQVVQLVKDVSETDRYDRLLRYVYVGDTFVNAELVRQGFAEVVSYPPDTAQFENFRTLEIEATNAGRGCHPTGIFNDGSYSR
ncbi:MAG: thermonuclease family protein [Anaerolineae bacterium]|nr:thermonuclease family protein [Anaerolineae bacterium]